MRGILVAAVLLAGCFCSFASGSSARPALKLLSAAPVSVRGLHFQSRERVRVVLNGPQHEQRAVRATTSGSFKVSFADTADDPCSAAFTVRAVGARGSYALLKVRPQCPPG